MQITGTERVHGAATSAFAAVRSAGFGKDLQSFSERIPGVDRLELPASSQTFLRPSAKGCHAQQQQQRQSSAHKGHAVLSFRSSMHAVQNVMQVLQTSSAFPICSNPSIWAWAALQCVDQTRTLRGHLSVLLWQPTKCSKPANQAVIRPACMYQ